MAHIVLGIGHNLLESIAQLSFLGTANSDPSLVPGLGRHWFTQLSGSVLIQLDKPQVQAIGPAVNSNSVAITLLIPVFVRSLTLPWRLGSGQLVVNCNVSFNQGDLEIEVAFNGAQSHFDLPLTETPFVVEHYTIADLQAALIGNGDPGRLVTRILSQVNLPFVKNLFNDGQPSGTDSFRDFLNDPGKSLGLNDVLAGAIPTSLYDQIETLAGVPSTVAGSLTILEPALSWIPSGQNTGGIGLSLNVSADLAGLPTNILANSLGISEELAESIAANAPGLQPSVLSGFMEADELGVALSTTVVAQVIASSLDAYIAGQGESSAPRLVSGNVQSVSASGNSIAVAIDLTIDLSTIWGPLPEDYDCSLKFELLGDGSVLRVTKADITLPYLFGVIYLALFHLWDPVRLVVAGIIAYQVESTVQSIISTRMEDNIKLSMGNLLDPNDPASFGALAVGGSSLAGDPSSLRFRTASGVLQLVLKFRDTLLNRSPSELAAAGVPRWPIQPPVMLLPSLKDKAKSIAGKPNPLGNAELVEWSVRLQVSQNYATQVLMLNGSVNAGVLLFPGQPGASWLTGDIGLTVDWGSLGLDLPETVVRPVGSALTSETFVLDPFGDGSVLAGLDWTALEEVLPNTLEVEMFVDLVSDPSQSAGAALSTLTQGVTFAADARATLVEWLSGVIAEFVPTAQVLRVSSQSYVQFGTMERTVRHDVWRETVKELPWKKYQARLVFANNVTRLVGGPLVLGAISSKIEKDLRR